MLQADRLYGLIRRLTKDVDQNLFLILADSTLKCNFCM